MTMAYPTDEAARIPLYDTGTAGPQLFLCAPAPSHAWLGTGGGWHSRWQSVIPMGYKAVVGYHKRAVLSAGREMASWSALTEAECAVLDADPYLYRGFHDARYSPFVIFTGADAAQKQQGPVDHPAALERATALSVNESGPVLLAERIWHTDWH